MRRALNDNPVAQIAVLGVLAVIVAFLLMSRGSHNSGSTASSATPAAPAPADTGSAAVAPTTAPPPGTATGAPAGGFVAGPGLPAPVVKAYADDKAVVLFVFRHRGVDDSASICPPAHSCAAKAGRPAMSCRSPTLTWSV